MRAVRVLAGGALLYGVLRLGTLLADGLGLPLPGSVLAMVLLWAGLEAGVVPLAWVREAATTLLGLLGLLFVPAGAGFVAFVDAGWVWPVAVAVAGLGAAVSIGLTGLVAQHAMRRG